MADTFDPYREALVVETSTVWPTDCDLDQARRYQLACALHANPQDAAHLEYTRIHSGFCRTIHVTAADIERAASLVGGA